MSALLLSCTSVVSTAASSLLDLAYLAVPCSTTDGEDFVIVTPSVTLSTPGSSTVLLQSVMVSNCNVLCFRSRPMDLLALLYKKYACVSP